MTQHMDIMDFIDEEDAESKEIVCHIKLLPPFDSELGWSTRDIYDGERRSYACNTHASANVAIRP